MIPNGVELFRVFQRETPDGDTYFAGWFGDACVAMIRDPEKPGVWRVIVSDPSRPNDRGAPPARAIAAPAHDDDLNVVGEDFDELPADIG